MTPSICTVLFVCFKWRGKVTNYMNDLWKGDSESRQFFILWSLFFVGHLLDECLRRKWSSFSNYIVNGSG